MQKPGLWRSPALKQHGFTKCYAFKVNTGIFLYILICRNVIQVNWLRPITYLQSRIKRNQVLFWTSHTKKHGHKSKVSISQTVHTNGMTIWHKCHEKQFTQPLLYWHKGFLLTYLLHFWHIVAILQSFLIASISNVFILPSVSTKRFPCSLPFWPRRVPLPQEKFFVSLWSLSVGFSCWKLLILWPILVGINVAPKFF